MGTITRTEKSAGRLRRLTTRFARSDRGVTAIEFAIVGPVFLALVGATIETALAFFAGYALDAAVIDSSRLIRTGQDAYISSADNYGDAVCDQLYGIFNCEQLQISVKVIGQFSDFWDNVSPYPIDEESGDWDFEPEFGDSNGQIPADTNVMIEAYYKWPTFFNIPGLNAGQTADGKRLLAATHVLKTEPFGL